jgi:hypothetical protein
MRRRGWRVRTALAAAFAVVLCTAAPVRAGSTEPELALADVTASVHAGVVTIEATGNFDLGNYLRLGYPVEVVVTQDSTVARLGLDGSVTLAVGGGPASPLPGAPGIIAIAPGTLTGVLPAAFGTTGSAAVRLEATFDGTPLASNTVEVQW